MKMLNRIKVRNVKGISEADIECSFYPNQPNFLVAPNGTGKSSLATAFSSLNKNRLKLDESNYNRGNDDSNAYIEIGFRDGNTFSADKNKNEINKCIDTAVIHSGLYARAVNNNYGNYHVPKASIRVPDIVLWDSVPKNTTIEYSVKNMRDGFPKHLRHRVINLTDLLNDKNFLDALLSTAPSSISGKRYSSAINNFLNNLETQAGARSNSLEDFRTVDVKPIHKIANLLARFCPELEEVDRIINAIQVCWLFESQAANIKKRFKYLDYKQNRSDVDALIKALNTTGLNLKTENIKGKVSLKLPDRSQLSNGELDVLNFAASLVKVRGRLRKGTSILLIDEVFDYLDDANLLVAQYYLLQMMERYKAEGKSLYVIILTHMDPHLMQSYRFKVKHVSYFSHESVGSVSNCMKALLSDRPRCKKAEIDTYNDVSRRYLHYSPDTKSNKVTEAYLGDKGFPKEFQSVEGFTLKCRKELERYLQGNKYDITMVCCAVRVAIESQAYSQLKSSEQDIFINAKTTSEKLEMAVQAGAEVPDLHFLLGGVYNPAMHLGESVQKVLIIGRKLDNKIVRRMVEQACNVHDEANQKTAPKNGGLQ